MPMPRIELPNFCADWEPQERRNFIASILAGVLVSFGVFIVNRITAL